MILICQEVSLTKETYFANVTGKAKAVENLNKITSNFVFLCENQLSNSPPINL